MRRSTLMTQNTQKPCENSRRFFCAVGRKGFFIGFSKLLFSFALFSDVVFSFFISLVYNKYTQQQWKKRFCCVGCATNVVNIFIKCHALHDVTENLLLTDTKKTFLSFSPHFSSSDCKGQ